MRGTPRESMIDAYVAAMDVTPNAVAARLRTLATAETFFDLDRFVPQTARDVAVLYEIRSGAIGSLPGLDIRKGPSAKLSRFVSGPSLLIRRKEERP